MTTVIHNEQIPFVVVLLKKITSHACQLDLRRARGNQPDLSIEAVQLGKDIVEPVELWLDEQLVFLPTDEADVDGLVA
jgi:hypothetical protein